MEPPADLARWCQSTVFSYCLLPTAYCLTFPLFPSPDDTDFIDKLRLVTNKSPTTSYLCA